MQVYVQTKAENLPVTIVWPNLWPCRIAEDGYRLLRDGEIIRPDDEYFHPDQSRESGSWVEVDTLFGPHGMVAGDWYWGMESSHKILFRRKITKGEQALSQIPT